MERNKPIKVTSPLKTDTRIKHGWTNSFLCFSRWSLSHKALEWRFSQPKQFYATVFSHDDVFGWMCGFLVVRYWPSSNSKKGFRCSFSLKFTLLLPSDRFPGTDFVPHKQNESFLYRNLPKKYPLLFNGFFENVRIQDSSPVPEDLLLTIVSRSADQNHQWKTLRNISFPSKFFHGIWIKITLCSWHAVGRVSHGCNVLPSRPSSVTNEAC